MRKEMENNSLPADLPPPQTVLDGLITAAPMTSVCNSGYKAERRRKTTDNHQFLQYLSSKRLKAHIAYNWI